jgi:hypothetical protein
MCRVWVAWEVDRETGFLGVIDGYVYNLDVVHRRDHAALWYFRHLVFSHGREEDR